MKTFLACVCLALSPLFTPLLSAAEGADDPIAIKFYATLDLYYDRTVAGKNTKNSWRSGGMSPTYIGLKGSYQLTDEIALKAQGESNYDIVHHRWYSDAMGDRRATVGFSSPWGTIHAGRQFTPHALFLGGEIDPFGFGFNGTTYMVLDAGIDLLHRDHAFLYESPALFDHFHLQLMKADDAQGKGAEARGSDDVFVQGDYRKDGLVLGLVYVDQQRYKGPQARQVLALGSSYQMDGLTLMLGLQRTRNTEARNDAMEYILGFKSRVFVKHELLGSYGLSSFDEGDRGGDVLSFAYSYDIAKTITAYSSIAWLRNFGRSAFNFGREVEAGAPTSNMMAGVRIRL